MQLIYEQWAYWRVLVPLKALCTWWSFLKRWYSMCNVKLLDINILTYFTLIYLTVHKNLSKDSLVHIRKSYFQILSHIHENLKCQFCWKMINNNQGTPTSLKGSELNNKKFMDCMDICNHIMINFESVFKT